MSFLRIDWPLILKKMEQTLKKDYSLINKRLSTFLQQFKRLSNNHETILNHREYSILPYKNYVVSVTQTASSNKENTNS